MTDYDVVQEVFSVIDDPSMDCPCCRKKELEMLLNHLNEHSPQCKFIPQIKARIIKEQNIIASL